MQIILLLVVLLFATQTSAYGPSSHPALVTAETRQLDLTPYVHLFIDADKRHSIESLTAPDHPLPFQKLQATGKSFGFNDSILWLKFTVATDPGVSQPLLLHYGYPILDDLRLYETDDRGALLPVRISGDRYPFAQRDIAFRDFLFPLTQQPGTTKTYYMRLQTEGSLQLSLAIWTASSLLEHIDASGLIFGIYYGIMLILMLSAAVAYARLRDFLFLSYALYLLSFLLFQFSINGFSFQYLWPDLNGWVNRLNTMTVGLAVIFGFIFCGIFLRVWRRRDGFMYLYNLFILFGLISVLLSLFGNVSIGMRIAAFAGILLPPVVIISNIAAVHAGYRPARFFLAAWGIFLAGAFISGLLYFGLIDRNFFSVYSIQIASLIKIIILGYVLFEHVQKLTIEKQTALLSAQDSLRKLNEGLESEVAARTEELSEKNRQLSDMTLHDSMTGLLNHNTIIDHLGMQSKSALRYRHDLSVIMLDVDHFKQINDRHGHQAGDRVLMAIAKVLKHSIRASDSCGRYGGEEFMLLLPQTRAENAVELAEAIRKKISQMQLPDIAQLSVTASFGITEFDPAHADTDLIRDADKALYRAKENGRNQVVVYADRTH